MKNILIFNIATFGVFISLSAQGRIYVNPSATGANTGQSWTDAFLNLQTALQAAQTGDEVWLAEGTYLPASDANRDSSFQLKSGAKLYGGFAGTESNLNERDWQAHPTILSGDIGVPIDSTDNSYTILFLDNPDSLTVLDGLVFRFGNADYPGGDFPPTSSRKCGGALYIMADWEAYVQVENCRFERNSAINHGGAVYVNGAGGGWAGQTFRGCFFECNTAGRDGGAVAHIGNSPKEHNDYQDCDFRYNKAGRNGGGLYYVDGEADVQFNLIETKFLKNSASNSGGAATLQIGRANGSQVLISGCKFEENMAPERGGLALLNRSGLYYKSIRIEKCLFEKNNGRQIYGDLFELNEQTTITFQSSVFKNNLTGVGIEMRNAPIATLIVKQDSVYNSFPILFVIAKVVIVDGLFSVDSYSIGPVSGDTILLKNALFSRPKKNITAIISCSINDRPVFNNCTFSNLMAGHWVFPELTQDMIVEFNNCIFDRCAFNFPPFVEPYNVYLNYCSFKDSTLCSSPFSEYEITCGPNNLFNFDPLFRDTANHDYSLLPCSPLINAGSNAAAMGILTDIAGNPRIQGGTVDIGAYEAPAFSLAAEPLVAPACAGDSNGSINVSPVFGCEPYSYDWSPAAGNGSELNGLPPGNYLLTITDGSGRQILDTVSVAEAPVPVLNPVASDVQCGTTLGGSIAANVSGGTAPFQYQWLPNAADTSNLGHLSPGAYALTVVDGNGCQDSASASIALMGLLTLMVDGQGISCHGETDGWLSGLPATGAAPFSWLWQGWPGSDSIAQPLGPGIYAVTVSDAFGCTASFAFPPMNQPDSLWATVGTQAQTDPNMPNGAAVVTTISGGTSPYEYFWEPGGSTTQAIAGLTAGNYMVTVTDKNGCEAVVEVLVDSMIVGTEDVEGQAFVVYPNPAVDWVKVVFSKPVRGGLLELSDASGRVLRSSELAAGAAFGTVEMSGLPGGNYVVVVRNGAGAGLFVGKVLKK